MNKCGLWLSLLLASLAPVYGQVTVQLTQDQEQFLPGEAVQTAVRITNRSGQNLRLGNREDWLTFSVEQRDGAVVSRLADVPVLGEFDLPPGKVAVKRVDLAPCFALSEPGRYLVTATVRIPEWGRETASPPKGFDVIAGGRLWEQTVGMPLTADSTNATPEVRRYVLQQANYIRGQLRLYLRVTDASGQKVFRVYPIGRILSFTRTEQQVDKVSNLHLLYQDHPHSFTYLMFDPNGEILARQTHDYVGTRPRLSEDRTGRIFVAGGVRRQTAFDIPTPKPATVQEDSVTPDDVKPPKS